MTTVRVRIDKRLVKELSDQFETKIMEEFGITPTQSQIVMIALIEAKSLKNNIEAEIKFMKNGKISYKFR